MKPIETVEVPDQLCMRTANLLLVVLDLEKPESLFSEQGMNRWASKIWNQTGIFGS